MSASSGSAPAPMLTMSGVWAAYDRAVPVLRGVDLAVASGEIVALLGGNGAGKSTALKAIAGLVPVGAGRIQLAGEDIAGLAPHRIVARGIAFAVQGKEVFPSMSVEENLLLGAFSRRDGEAVKADIEKTYATFPVLSNRRGQAAALLSGGERQILVIARALLARPRLLLVDEPSAALAPRLIDEVMGILTTLREQGLSILLVEQNVTAALEIADRFFVLREGRVVLDGVSADRDHFEEIKRTYYGVVMGDSPNDVVRPA